MSALVQRVIALARKRLYLLALVWLVSLVISYLIIHQPVTSIRQALAAPLLRDLGEGLASPDWPTNMAISLGGVARDLFQVLMVVLLGGGLGRLALRNPETFNEVERPALQALLGLGAISIAILFVGLLGALPIPPLGWLIEFALLISLLRPVWGWLRDLRRAISIVLTAPDSKFHAWLLRAIAVFLLLSFLMALAPPTKWDALTYHLEAPRHYLEAGRVVAFPENHFFGFPQLVEMLYLWLMIVARAQAAASLHWVFGALTLLLVAGLARRIQRPSAGVLAIAVLLVCDSIWLEFGWPYNDLTLMAYVTASATALLGWSDRINDTARPPAGWIVDTFGAGLAGVFIGLAMGIKYTAASAALGVGVLTLWLSRRGGLRSMALAGGLVAGAAVTVFAPWLIKNALLDGNPLSPFVWGTSQFDRLDQWYYLRPGTGLDVMSALLAPIQGAVFGQEGYAPYGSSTGALIVSLLPMALVAPARFDSSERRALQSLVILVVPAYLFWLAGAATSWYLTQTRLLYPIFPALAIIGAAGMDRLAETRLPINLGVVSRVAVLVSVTIALVASVSAFVSASALPATLGLKSEQRYLEDTLGAHVVAMRRVSELPEGSKIVFLWEPRVFYCQRVCVPDSLINQWWHDRQLEPDPRKIADRWRREGVTHVLIFEDGLRFLVEEEPNEPLSDADVAALEALRADEMILIADVHESYSLYELKLSP